MVHNFRHFQNSSGVGGGGDGIENLGVQYFRRLYMEFNPRNFMLFYIIVNMSMSSAELSQRLAQLK